MVFLSVICQFGLAVLFAKEAREAISNQSGAFCVIKCTLAAVMYLSLGILLAWLLLTQPIKTAFN